MSEQNDPFDTRLRRLVADAVADSPTPPPIEEMSDMTTNHNHPSTRNTTRRWLAGGSIGLVAAALVALLLIPSGDDDALRPVDTPPVTDIDESIVPQTTTVDGVEPATSTPTTTPAAAPSSATTTVVTAPTERTVIAAIDGEGDAVLIPTDLTGPFVMFDGPSPSELATVTEGAPNSVDIVALAPDGSTAYVGLCCEPIAGSVLSGAPTGISDEGSLPLQGYAPAVSPDGRYLAIGQIFDSAVTIADLSTGRPLDVPTIAGTDGVYTPSDTMWLDAGRLVSLGTLPTDTGVRWVAFPMTIDGGTVTVGEPLDVNETLSANSDGTPRVHDVVRLAGQVGSDRFVVHSQGEEFATSIEFRLDGRIAADQLAKGQGADDTGEPARSIWYRADGSVVWVGEDGTLHDGDVIVPGSYVWARPTGAVTFDATPDEAPAPIEAIDLASGTLFGMSNLLTVGVDGVVAQLSADLGSPTFDTEWTAVGPEWACTGASEARTVWWGDLRITFERSDVVQFATWSVGDPDVADLAPIGELPLTTEASGVTTSNGFGIGSTRSAVQAAADAAGLTLFNNTETDLWVVQSNAATSIVLFDGDTVSGIGAGRFDCIDESGGDL